MVAFYIMKIKDGTIDIDNVPERKSRSRTAEKRGSINGIRTGICRRSNVWHCNYVLPTDWQVGGAYGNQSGTLTGLIFMA